MITGINCLVSKDYLQFGDLVALSLVNKELGQCSKSNDGWLCSLERIMEKQMRRRFSSNIKIERNLSASIGNVIQLQRATDVIVLWERFYRILCQSQNRNSSTEIMALLEQQAAQNASAPYRSEPSATARIQKAGEFSVWLEENMEQLYWLIGLGLQNDHLTSLPSELVQFSNLQKLYLSGNKFTFMPSIIFEIEKIKILDCSNNQIRTLPKTISLLTNLKDLDLSENSIRKIPEEIGQLGKLKSLDLSHSRIGEIPNVIFGLSYLESLGFAANQISEIPLDIARLTNLCVLDLSDNLIEDVPNEIAHLSKLQDLSLISNPCSSLPESVWDLPLLNSLFIPKGVYSTHAQQVKRLQARGVLIGSGRFLIS